MRALVFIAFSLVACSQPFGEDEIVRSQEVQTMAAIPSCGPGWGMAPDSFAGLEGRFERAGPAAAGEMITLDVSGVVNADVGVVGEADALRTFACNQAKCSSETTRASLLPTGTATTPMILFSANGFARWNPDLRGLFDVLGLERGDDGKINALCLQRVDARANDEPFIMTRSSSR